MNLREKLNKIQCALIAPKNLTNNFGKYSYRSCEEILKALKPHLLENKVTIRLQDEILLIGDRYYIQSYAILEDCESDEAITNTAFARESLEKKGMDESQITGSSSSYARKYALAGLFAIDNEQDADARYGKDEPEMTDNLKAQIEERNSMLADIAFAKGDEYIEKLLTKKGAKTIDELPTDYIKKAWTMFCTTKENA